MIILIKQESKQEKFPEKFTSGLFLQIRWTAPDGKRMDSHTIIPGIAKSGIMEQRICAENWIKEQLLKAEADKTLNFN